MYHIQSVLHGLHWSSTAGKRHADPPCSICTIRQEYLCDLAEVCTLAAPQFAPLSCLPELYWGTTTRRSARDMRVRHMGILRSCTEKCRTILYAWPRPPNLHTGVPALSHPSCWVRAPSPQSGVARAASEVVERYFRPAAGRSLCHTPV